MKISGRVIALLAVVAAIHSTPVRAQTGEVRCPAVGTQLRYSQGGAIESLGEAGAHICQFKNLSSGKTFGRLLVLDTSAPIVQANMDKIRTLFPLQVGKSISYQNSGADNTGGNGAWVYTLSVESYEAVTIPIGVLPAFVILLVERTHGGGGLGMSRFLLKIAQQALSVAEPMRPVRAVQGWS